MPRVGYVLYTYRHPEQIRALSAELVRSADTASVRIHHDAKSGPLREVNSDPRVSIVEEPVRVHWGDWTQVIAIVETTQQMLHGTPDIDWIVLLTGQDWPVVRVSEIGQRLGQLEVDACIEAVPSKERWGWDAARRYGYRWYQLPDWAAGKSQTLRWIDRIVPGVRHIGRYTAMQVDRIGIYNRDLRRRTLVGGLEYFMVNRRAWDAVVRAYQNPRERRAFDRAFIPTEVFFATAIRDAGLKIGPSLRYQRFVVGQPNPERITREDLFIARSSGALFARKVHPEDVDLFRDVLAHPGLVPPDEDIDIVPSG